MPPLPAETIAFLRRDAREQLIVGALEAAARGLPVFPCRRDKAPATPRGFKDASTDPDAIRRMFAHQAAELIGMPTGHVSGIVAVDLDCKRGGVDASPWYMEHEARLPETRRHDTMNGGLHLLFRAPEVEIRNRAGRMAPGVDVRGDGGYIIIPPSPGYIVTQDAPLADMPDWLIEACTAPKGTSAPEPASADTSARADSPARLAAYDRAAMEGELGRLLTAPEGTRNTQLNEAAVKLGSLVGARRLERSTVEGALAAAAHAIGLEPDKAAATIRSGLGHGITTPREWPPDRPAAAQPARPPQRPASLRVLTPADCAASQPRGYIVKGLLAPGDLFLLVAKPGGGKSALAPSIGYAIAQGREVFKRRTKPGTVLYVPVEDPHGMRQRVHALRKEHGDAPGFLVVEGVSDLFSPDSPDPEALSALAQERGASLVIIDTLAAAFRGMDELKGEEMARAIKVARDLTGLGCAVMILCHPNKAAQSDDGTPRGHSSLQAEADVGVFLEWESDGSAIRGRMTKNRNGAAVSDGLTITIRSVRIGTDEDGDAITAAVAVETDAFGRAAAQGLVESAAEKKFLELMAWHQPHGLELSPSPTANNSAPIVFSRHAKRGGFTKSHFKHAMDALLDRGVITVEEHGPPSKRVKRLVLAGAGAADTAEADPDGATD